MRLTFFTAVASVLAVLGIAAQQPQFRAGSDAVRVFATVTDRDGRLVTTLKQEDFELRDEGKPQPITLFDNTPQPVRLLMLLDVSGSMTGNLTLLRSASDELFARLRPDDLVKVGTFGRTVSINPSFTRDRSELRASLPRDIDPEAPTPLWRAIADGLGAFDEGDQVRHVILVLSDGKDTGPLSFRERPVSQADVIDRARADDVMIYAVAMRSRSMRSQPMGIGRAAMQAALLADLPDPGLARVAEETGGGFLEIRFGEDLGPAFASVADELHNQYLLGFAPPKRDGKTHDIRVKATGDGLKVRARKSYLAPKA